MNLNRISIVLVHSWYHMTHSLETVFAVFIIPIMQFLVFGFIAYYFAQGNSEVLQFVLLGYLLWIVVQIGQFSVTISVLWEIKISQFEIKQN